MKRNWYLIILLMLTMGAIFLAGACGDDDDDDDDDSSMDDDDDNTDDDDDATGEVEVTNVQTGECGEAGPQPYETVLNAVEAKWEAGVLTVYRRSALLNCDPVLDIAAELVDGVLTISETDSGLADCICATDLQYDVQGIPETSNVEIVIKYGTAKKSVTGPVADFNVQTDSGEYFWMIPFIEVLIQSGGPYSANQDIAMEIGVCYLESLADVQFFMSRIDNTVIINGLDKRALPVNPSVRNETCAQVDWTFPGLAAGSYDMVAPAQETDGEIDLFVNQAPLEIQ